MALIKHDHRILILELFRAPREECLYHRYRNPPLLPLVVPNYTRLEAENLVNLLGPLVEKLLSVDDY